MQWDLNCDMFVFKISNAEQPYTRRGLLSTMNSIFDPMGFISPVTISGKILHFELVSPGCHWDEPLTEEHLRRWRIWIDSLQSVNNIRVPRMIVATSISLAHQVDVHVFSDASEHAIAAVAYLQVTDEFGETSLGFLMGKSKLAHLKGHTIPRLELCAAVLATELGEAVCDYLKIPQDRFHYYTDSRIVLGYICNKTRSFFVYVTYRVEKIHKVSSPSQWSYVSTDKNPADGATRYSHTAITTSLQRWITGPPWLKNSSDMIKTVYPLINPETDKEIRQDVISSKTQITTEIVFDSRRFARFSTWKNLVVAFQTLKRFVRDKFQVSSKSEDEPDIYRETEMFIIKQIQQESYSKEIENLNSGQPIPRNSKVSRLDPFLDSFGVLRVGGRLKLSPEFSLGEKNPILIPNQNYIAKLLVLHFHEVIRHQGRHLTAGAIRAAGYWITGCKRLVYSILSNCLQGAVWKFNTPFSSHMGGAWERLIGVIRRIIGSILLDSKHTRITHEVLSTFMAEATAIVNARPLKNEYLQSLQVRRKWKDTRDNIQVGDVVLLKDRDAHRNHWPTGFVERVFLSKNGLVRKLEVRVIKDGQSRVYVRPNSEIIVLCHSI
nr:uncharacterized protein LOC117690928 [Crassostrea gigas]